MFLLKAKGVVSSIKIWATFNLNQIVVVKEASFRHLNQIIVVKEASFRLGVFPTF